MDLIFRVEREGAEILAGRNPVIGAGHLRGCGPAWEKVAALCGAWLDGGHPAWGLVRHLWLELDLDAPAGPGAPPVPPPSVFLALEDDATAAMDADARLSGSVGNVLDPVFSIRRTVALEPGESATLIALLVIVPVAYVSMRAWKLRAVTSLTTLDMA
mgnify:CR=1 FL=1